MTRTTVMITARHPLPRELMDGTAATPGAVLDLPHGARRHTKTCFKTRDATGSSALVAPPVQPRVGLRPLSQVTQSLGPSDPTFFVQPRDFDIWDPIREPFKIWHSYHNDHNDMWGQSESLACGSGCQILKGS
jgi:hypothetical protein